MESNHDARDHSLRRETSMEPPDEERKKGERDKQVAVATSDVKSTAVVKYANDDLPAKYQQLQVNTNLNKPPSNWLHGNSRWENYIRSATTPGPDHPFTSFKMAHCFPELAGEVDVITDSENIKRLLKIPFNKGQVSMMVHRVGNTLLLDEFDVHKYLLRQQQDDWTWLRKFYYDTIHQNMQAEKCMVKKNKRRDHLQNRNMYSKFLYYSLPEGQVLGHEGEQMTRRRHSSLDSGAATALIDQIPALIDQIPDPLRTPEPNESDHQRTVQWTFEDLRMLIGTDLPIFGGGNRPGVSLKLRDMHKPINVLTGLDYWLDNLMCNVPELAMCYHLNGIVQSYELVKTEEIPNIEESRFRPQVVKDIAQNILSFLKSNATKEGHTYWLFKGQNDDVVKLYDLTTVCEDIVDKSGENPFSVPVAMLLYRVARNLRQTCGRKKSATIRTLLQNCLSLLDKDLHSQVVTSAHYLLSDLYISDSVSLTGDESCEQQEDSDDTESEASEQTESEAELGDDPRGDDPRGDGPRGDDVSPDPDSGQSSVEVQSLRLHDHVPRPQPDLDIVRYPPIVGDQNTRCHESLQHIAQGLECLDKNASSYDTSKHRVDEQAKCNPDMPIPLHYEPISSKFPANQRAASESPEFELTNESQEISQIANQRSASESSDFEPTNEKKSNSNRANQKSVDKYLTPQGNDMRRSKSPENMGAKELSLLKSNMPKNSWHVLSKALLLRKAATVYYSLADWALKESKQGTALKYLRIGLYCFRGMESLMSNKASENSRLQACIYGLLGDAHVMLAHQTLPWQQQQLQFEDLTSQDRLVLESASREISSFEFNQLDSLSTAPDKSLKTAILFYNKAISVVSKMAAEPEQQTTLVHLKKRLGNAQNEAGVVLMNMAASKMVENGGECDELSSVKELWTASYQSLEDGIATFTSLKDNVNAALLHSNLGKLMRLCAQRYATMVTQPHSREFTTQERHYFVKAAEHYQTALSCLEKRELSPEVWGSICWELSSTYFTLATSLQDYAPLSTMAQEQVEKDVTEYMMKSLKYCDVDTVSARQPTCQYRAATVHHRLASLYHNSYRNQTGEQKRRHLRTLAELHYSKAVRYFSLLDSACEMFRVQLERVAMAEFTITGQTSANSRFRSLQQTLSLLLECNQPIRLLVAQMEECSQSQSPDQPLDGYTEETEKLIGLFKSRLEATLLALVKTCASVKKGEKNQMTKYKQMYGCVLKGSSDNDSPLATRCQHMLGILESLQTAFGSVEKSL